MFAVAAKSFWTRLGKGLDQSKAVPVSYPKPTIPLFRALVTVMAKWFNQWPSSPNNSPSFIFHVRSVLHTALYRRCQRVVILLRSSPLLYHIRMLMTYKQVETAVVHEIAHVLSFYPTASKLSLFSLYGSGFLDTGRFSKLPYLGMQSSGRN